MKNAKRITRVLSDPQILSAMIWATTIVLCGQSALREHFSTILITAAGFHVLLMAYYRRGDQSLS